MASGLTVARFLRGNVSSAAATIWISAGIGAMGYFSAILIIWPGGRGPLHSIFDCSCFLTEGYGMIWPITWTPILVVATVARELVTRRMLIRKQ